MKLFLLLALLCCLILAASPYQLHFINAIRKGDIQKVREMLNAGSYESMAQAEQAEDEEAPKRRRLDPIDPSVSDNLAVFIAISADNREVLDLLLSHPRVKGTLCQFRLTMKCIERGYNDIARSYLVSQAQEDFTEFFTRAAIYNNTEILELLASDCRVNLEDAVSKSMCMMTRYEEIDKVFLFFLENQYTKDLYYDKSLMLELGCAKKSMSVLLKLFSLEENIWPEVECMCSLLKQGEWEVPVFALASSPENFSIFRRYIGIDLQWLTDPMQWFRTTPLDQLDKERIQGHRSQVQDAFLAQACLHDDVERLNFLLPLNLKLSSEMVTMLVASTAASNQMEVFSALLSSPPVLRCLNEQSLNSLTEWFIQTGNVMGQMCMIHIVSQILEPFSLLHAQLMDLDDEAAGLDSQLSELAGVVDGLQAEGLKGLASIARLTLAHHTAMVTVNSQDILLPKEIRHHIYQLNQDSLSLNYHQ